MGKRSFFGRAILAVALCACLAFGAAVPASAVSVSQFTDVGKSAWYYDAISYVVNNGLFNGTSSTAFSPSGTMTRGMFITVLGRYAGVDPSSWCAGTVTGSSVNLRSGPGTSYTALTSLSKGTSVTITGESGGWYKVKYGSYAGYISKDYLKPTYHRFADVDYSAYYAGYVIWGYEKGIVNGITSSRFSPNTNVTREQICKLLAGYASYAGITLNTKTAAVTFTDKSSISSWAISGVNAMQRAGVVNGEKDGSGYRFRPKSSATRAEAAAIFQRFSTAGTGGSGSSGGSGGGSGGGSTADTPATFLSEKIACKAMTVRVGILANSQSYKYAVQTVTLENTTGSKFQYGSFASDRSFVKAGEISSPKLTITTNGTTFTVKNASGAVVHTTNANLAIHPVGANAVTRVNGNYRYHGDFELRQAYGASGYISVISYVDIEDYVRGVLPYEYSASWPTETLKAGAVAARSYVMASDWSAYSKYGFDIMGNSSAQNYRGRGISYSESYFSSTDAAVNATKGVYLTYVSGGTNRICTTFYSACDGGATEDAAHIWGTSYSYLIGKVDPYEQAASKLAENYEKTITLSRTGSTMNALAQKVGLGSTSIAKNGIKIQTYPATGNVKSIVLTGTNGRTVTINQSTSFGRWDFLSALGFTAYSFRYSVTYNSSADTFTITRNGWGHNVGMSQWGAYAMARYYNKTYQDILGFYFTGTHLQYGVY